MMKSVHVFGGARLPQRGAGVRRFAAVAAAPALAADDAMTPAQRRDCRSRRVLGAAAARRGGALRRPRARAVESRRDPRSGWHAVRGRMLPGGKVFNWLLSKRSFGSVQVHLEFREPEPARGNGPGARQQRRAVDGGLRDPNPGRRPQPDVRRRPPGRGVWPDSAHRGAGDASRTVAEPRHPLRCAALRGQEARQAALRDGAARWRRRAGSSGDLRQYQRPQGPPGLSRRAPTRGPVGSQDHGEPSSIVAFRNIWVRPLHPHGR